MNKRLMVQIYLKMFTLRIIKSINLPYSPKKPTFVTSK